MTAFWVIPLYLLALRKMFCQILKAIPLLNIIGEINIVIII